MPPRDPARPRVATRLAFLVAGFGISSWGPLIPYAQSRLGLSDSNLGLLLLCLGIGSMVAMPLGGRMSARTGSKPVITVSAVCMIGLLPLLSVAPSPMLLALLLFLFGAALGSLDVAMNIHAIQVERKAQKPLMSGFHALYSVGGIAGSFGMSTALSLRLAPLASTVLCSGLMLIATLIAQPQLIVAGSAEPRKSSAVPRGIVLLLAALAGITFLSEGAVLDWGAVLITDQRLLSLSAAGLGYSAFSLAMTAGRVAGDYVTARFGERLILLCGSSLAAVGFLAVACATHTAIAMVGFLSIGLGASNIVPVLFRAAGRQRVMPVDAAVAAIAIVGYGGILIGPAAIGLLSQTVGLRVAFGALSALLLLVAAAAGRITQSTSAFPARDS